VAAGLFVADGGGESSSSEAQAPNTARADTRIATGYRLALTQLQYGNGRFAARAEYGR
jgi:hypothetical protein